MAHFLTLVIVERMPPRPLVRAQVIAGQLLAPFFRPGSHLGDQYKCDGWVIGGRYDGLIFGKEQKYSLTPLEFQKRYGLDIIKLSDNIRPVSELPDELIKEVYALITPDGKWHDREDKTNAEWASKFNEIKMQFPSLLAVAVDCHC